MDDKNRSHHWDLFWMLTRTEFRLRDQGTLAGFFWTLLHPLFIFMILYLLFTHWMSPKIPFYAGCLLIGIVQWNFFSTATTAGLTSLRRKAGLIGSYAFPRIFVVLSSLFAVLLSHLLEWAVLLPILILMGVRPTLLWLALPWLIVVELALAVGLSCLLAVFAVDVRDLEHVWSLFLYGFFFLTPIFYTTQALGGPALPLIALNPLTWIIEMTRAVLIAGAYPLPPQALAPAAAILTFCAVSLSLFGRLSRGIVERL